MIGRDARFGRRALDAMGLGPAWLLRERARHAPDADVADVADAADIVARDTRIATMSFDELDDTIVRCTACRLHASRTHAVPGVGAREPEWLVVGEAPGADEDARGEPFVGQAGKLLDAMLAAAGRDRRRDAFIANILKCRPPGNRDPSADEIAACRPFLMRQLELLAPKLVLVVGRIASDVLLDTDSPVSRTRGKVHRLAVGGRDIPLVVTYHPAYLLRTPEDKGKAWADLCLARRTHRAAVDA